jgi:hypothetical protein
LLTMDKSDRVFMVSIPSRRVGDEASEAVAQAFVVGFHPLKAGRRPRGHKLPYPDQRVSIPSRRVGD